LNSAEAGKMPEVHPALRQLFPQPASEPTNVNADDICFFPVRVSFVLFSQNALIL
jgi:hypothetical protein